MYTSNFYATVNTLKMTHVSLTQEAIKAIQYNIWKKHAFHPSSEHDCRALTAVMNDSRKIELPAEVLYSVYLKDYKSRIDARYMVDLAFYFGYDCWKKWLAENSSVIRAVIVDDEAPSRENLEAILKTFCDKVMVVAKATTLGEAHQVIHEMRPDLVLLDIHLGQDSGLDLLSSIPDTATQIMFVTAYKDYNAKPLLEKPYEYILKPVDLDMMHDAVERVRTRVFQE
jgi:CheY-like chemotaxis protein